MGIDFENLAKPRQVTVPVLNRSFQLDRKRYSIDSADGWFRVEIAGNKASALFEDSTDLIPSSKITSGYTHNNTIVFWNFDVARRKFGFGPIRDLHFNRSGTFESIYAVVWEDKKVYYANPIYNDIRGWEVSQAFEENKPLDQVKGVTPELRMVYLHHLLEREQQLKLAAEAKAKEDHERMIRDIPYRLAVNFQRAGAELISHSISGNRIIADWRIPGSDNEYNSVIDSRTWMIVEAGYCMTQDDKRHNITSMVKLAEDYEDRGLTYITRRT